MDDDLLAALVVGGMVIGGGDASFSLPFTDNFTRADGAIGGFWTGATWTISSNAALNTPTLGSEVLLNAGFEGTYDDESSGGGGTVNVAPNWNNNSCETDGTDTLDKELTTIHGGSASQKVIVDAVAEGVIDTETLLAHKWYQISFWAYRASGTGSMFMLDQGGGILTAGIGTTSTWVHGLAVGRIGASNRLAIIRSAAATGFNGFIDDASVKQLTLASVFATLPNVGIANVTAQVIVTVQPIKNQAGLVINLDSTSSPANFVIAYLDGDGNAKLDKCVAGVYTNVISGSVTFGATKYIKVVKSGDNYSLYYGTTDVQVGTTQSITSMNSTIHGLFSTYSTPQFDTYQLSATP